MERGDRKSFESPGQMLLDVVFGKPYQHELPILPLRLNILFSSFLSLHTIQKYNTIRMIDEVIRYPIYLASAFEIASLKFLMYVPLTSTFQLSKQFLYLRVAELPFMSIVERAQ